jgi:lysophosphatidic acid acyltransferase/lysophosphatidylinositol acyltransferase
MYLCRFPFLKRNWARDGGRISKTLGIFVNYKLPIWLVSFVEGHRLCQDKVVRSQEYAKENNLPVLANLLLPRCKGFIATAGALRGSHIKYVYDFTLSYHHRKRGFGATPSLFEIITGGLEDYQFHVHVDRIPIDKVPSEETEATEWLYDLYVKKDKLLGDIKAAFERRLKRD